MAHEEETPGMPEPETESSDGGEEEAPTEEHEPPAPDTQVSEVATVEVLAQEIEDLRNKAAERDDMLDRLARLKAEFANYQKRQERERERWGEEARRAFALRVLPVVDDLELALDAWKKSQDAQAVVRGVEMIHGKLIAALRAEGISPLDALGKPYDPAYHEGVAQLERPDVPEKTVVEVIRRGYTLGERLLRPARVVMAKGGKPPEARGNA